MPCGCCDNQRSTGSTRLGISPSRPTVTATAHARASPTVRGAWRSPIAPAAPLRRPRRGPPSPALSSSCPPLPINTPCPIVGLLVVSLLVVLLVVRLFALLGRHRRRHGRRIVGTQSHQLAQDSDHFLARI